MRRWPRRERNPVEKAIFKFGLGDKVRLSLSAEPGQIIGRAEYMNSMNSYLVRYLAGDGRAVESWWQEDAIEFQQ